MPRMFPPSSFRLCHIDLTKENSRDRYSRANLGASERRPKVQSVGLLTGWRISSEETTACDQKAAKVSETSALLFEL